MVPRNLQSLCSSQLSAKPKACLHPGDQSQATEGGRNFALQIVPIYRETLREWEKELKQGALTLLSQYGKSPLHEKGCSLILVLPVAAA